MNLPSPPRPVVLCILDGWGCREASENNAIRLAATPVFDRLAEDCPTALIDASEGEVGLPPGQMGNSEVGHMNLGAGRVVLQDLPRIDADIASGQFLENPALTGFIDKLQASGGTAHILGLLSPGGVHSHQDQMVALARALAKAGIPVRVHAFLDGRDTPPRSAIGYLERFAAGAGTPIATVIGRYYAMDRDQRWDRVARAYGALVRAEGEAAADPAAAVKQSYDAGADDEFVAPTVIGDYRGMRDGDGILMANFRADRAREILRALLDPEFTAFARQSRPAFAAALGMVAYASDLNSRMDTLYPPDDLRDTLGEIVSRNGLKQLRIAETEKYAHVTFFFNGGREAPYEGEDRILIPSPKVATYDLKPEMSAPEVTDELVAAIAGGGYDLVVCNYANGDMVGHTGKLDAAIRAVETLDHCIGRVRDAVVAAGGCLLITSDHGNVEQMADPASGQAHTAHTMNKVPLLLVNGPAAAIRLTDGRLADIAPTVLDLMSLATPEAMTGRNLVAAGRGDALGEAAAE
jgi:2,3-bisphosphoglycerate-independent phosphoglycerate mutase